MTFAHRELCLLFKLPLEWRGRKSKVDHGARGEDASGHQGALSSRIRTSIQYSDETTS